jgi:hypothetical protein
MVHLIAFELVGVRMPDEIKRLETAIKELGSSYAFHRTAWLLECELSNQAICERLAGLLRPTDRLMVTRIHRDWVASNIPQAEADWLSSRNFASAHDHDPTLRRIPTIRE